MRGSAAILALTLVKLHGPGGQIVEVNPEHVVGLREPRASPTEHFQKEIRCLIFTLDGKFTGVLEDCAEVIQKLGAK